MQVCGLVDLQKASQPTISHLLTRWDLSSVAGATDPPAEYYCWVGKHKEVRKTSSSERVAANLQKRTINLSLWEAAYKYIVVILAVSLCKHKKKEERNHKDAYL